jgi:hypothetical protein
MAPVWRLLAPANHEACLMIDLQGITWKKCQEDVYDHIVRGHALLKSYIKCANDREQTSWYGHIKGDKFHGGNDSKGVQIVEHLQFMDFATRAYDAYPHEITIRVVMAEPHNVSHQCTRPYL